MSSCTIAGYIIGIDKDGRFLIMQEPKLENTHQDEINREWAAAELEAMEGEVTFDVTPGVYLADLVMSGWQDYYGEYDSEATFENLKPLWTLAQWNKKRLGNKKPRRHRIPKRSPELEEALDILLNL